MVMFSSSQFYLELISQIDAYVNSCGISIVCTYGYTKVVQ